MIVFDIETGPLPWGELQKMVPPFDEVAAVPDPGQFDESDVKLGNLKDEEKIKAKVAEARAEHGRLIASVAVRRAQARNAHVEKIKEGAALSATTGRVLAIGMRMPEYGTLQPPMEQPGDYILALATKIDDIGAVPSDRVILRLSEESLLKVFWACWQDSAPHSFVGHNICGFDLPFLINRSWILGVSVPEGVVQFRGKWPNWHYRFVDTMDRWCMGRQGKGLGEVSLACGGPGKPEGDTGASFAGNYEAGGERREQALRYLLNDLAMTQAVADRVGIL